MNDSVTYPNLPTDRRSFTLKEACDLCLVKAHVLRYWEVQYKPHLAGITRRKGRRYYSSSAIHTIRQIADLKRQGLTSEGIRAALGGNGNSSAASAPALDPHRVRSELALIAKLLDP